MDKPAISEPWATAYKEAWMCGPGIDLEVRAEADAESAKHAARMEALPSSDLVDCLDSCLSIINANQPSFAKWVKYLDDLSAHERRWGVGMFTLTGGALGLDRAAIGAMSEPTRVRASIVIYLALTNAWFGPFLPSIWSIGEDNGPE